MLDLIRDIILATDLAHHLRIFKDLQKMADGMFPQGAAHPLHVCVYVCVLLLAKH